MLLLFVSKADRFQINASVSKQVKVKVVVFPIKVPSSGIITRAGSADLHLSVVDSSGDHTDFFMSP